MKTQLLLISIISTLVFGGCKKYEEGPKFTLRTVKNRLTNGSWDLQNLTVGGVNQTMEYKETRFFLSFSVVSDIEGKDYSYKLDYTYNGDLYQILNGSVDFYEDGDVMKMIPGSTLSPGGFSDGSPIFNPPSNNSSPYGFGSGTDWTIKKLTNKELWMETTVDRTFVSMKLTK